MDAAAPGLIRSGHLIAPDLPGLAYRPQRGSYSISSHAQAIVELLESLGGPSVLIGNSLGALVTIQIAASRPDLVASGNGLPGSSAEVGRRSHRPCVAQGF